MLFAKSFIIQLTDTSNVSKSNIQISHLLSQESNYQKKKKEEKKKEKKKKQKKKKLFLIGYICWNVLTRDAMSLGCVWSLGWIYILLNVDVGVIRKLETVNNRLYWGRNSLFFFFFFFVNVIFFKIFSIFLCFIYLFLGKNNVFL